MCKNLYKIENNAAEYLIVADSVKEAVDILYKHRGTSEPILKISFISNVYI